MPVHEPRSRSAVNRDRTGRSGSRQGATGPGGTAGHLLDLQRTAGNRAGATAVERDQDDGPIDLTPGDEKIAGKAERGAWSAGAEAGRDGASVSGGLARTDTAGVERGHELSVDAGGRAGYEWSRTSGPKGAQHEATAGGS